jgi:hypothetical protein
MPFRKTAEQPAARMGAAFQPHNRQSSVILNQARSDEAHKRRCELRDRTILSVADVRRNVILRAKQAKETRRGIIEALFHARVPSQGTIEYAAMLHDVSTSALVHHLRYLIRSGELDRVEGVYHDFENRADRHLYIEAFDEIAAQCALADSGDELRRRLVRICKLAHEIDAKLTNLWLIHTSPKTRNGIGHEPPSHNRMQHRAAMFRVRMLTRVILLVQETGSRSSGPHAVPVNHS